VTGNDVPDVDMPNIPQPQRQDEPVVTDADLVALLAGTTDVAPGLRPVADVLAVLVAEPTAMELAGEASALARFRRQAGAPMPTRRARRSANGLSSRFGVKVGASVTAVAVVLGGGAAAAFADVLPAPIQRLAHEAIGAPIPQTRHSLPSGSRSAAHSRSGMHGRSSMHGKPAARGGPGTGRQARPHPTPSPTAHGNPQGQGNQGNPQGKGTEGQGSGQGSQGNGQGNQGTGQAHHGKGQGQVSSQGPANGQAQQGKGPRGNSQASRRMAGHPRRSGLFRLVMESLTSRPVPRPGCGVAAARWAGWPA
jgi:hypothetical protein